MQERLAELGARIDSFAICLHSPDQACQCRKPQPKMILDLASREGLDLSRSVMVGDRLIDVAAGRSAGCKAILVRTGNGRAEELLLSKGRLGSVLEQPDYVADDLVAAVDWVLQHSFT
jgi:D-glycero-D-manno-heptose 1,7-bisphosphate phosphatase